AALERLHRERSARELLDGRTPTGPFGDGAARRAGRILAAWRRALVEAHAGPLPAAGVIGFGAVGEGEAVARLAPAIEVAAGGRTVLLVGRTDPLAGPLGSLLLAVGQVHPRHRLRGAIDAVALAA